MVEQSDENLPKLNESMIEQGGGDIIYIFGEGMVEQRGECIPTCLVNVRQNKPARTYLLNVAEQSAEVVIQGGEDLQIYLVNIC
jgi:hypothetical protein